MQMMYCIPKSYRENGLFQLHVMSAQWNRSRNNLAANQLDGYIKGREENGGLGLLPEEILEASFINGQKKPLPVVVHEILHSLGVLSMNYTAFKEFPRVMDILIFHNYIQMSASLSSNTFIYFISIKKCVLDSSLVIGIYEAL